MGLPQPQAKGGARRLSHRSSGSVPNRMEGDRDRLRAVVWASRGFDRDLLLRDPATRARRRAALASAAARLSDRSRYLRFGSAKPSLSERELDTLTELDRHSSDALLAGLIERASDEGHLALHATVLAEYRASIAMLRHAGFVRRSGPGVQIGLELAVAPLARSTAFGARRENP